MRSRMLRASAVAVAALTAAAIAVPGAHATTTGAPTAPAAHPAPAAQNGGGAWGGYVYPGYATGVQSYWTVPTVTCNSARDRFSQWVGLDGYGGSRTVEQIGIGVTCASGTPYYRAFSEMFPADPIFYTAPNTPVRPGDRMRAQVIYRGGVYYKTVRNVTVGWTITADEAGSAANASAEVVVEAPSGVYAQFGRADFDGARVDGYPLSSRPTVRAVSSAHGNGTQAAPGPLTNSAFSVYYYRET